ncbi:hypothetical protein [Desulfobotulus alkaliphilus]|uniref:hypothetical protein n=1 Tax=Desulfobotulus alkaliphilus TaxID=622671 RepID=UPI001C96C892|nr:hypothetical protein [Desulfobotulus alkaliphilus]
MVLLLLGIPKKQFCKKYFRAENSLKCPLPKVLLTQKSHGLQGQNPSATARIQARSHPFFKNLTVREAAFPKKWSKSSDFQRS